MMAEIFICEKEQLQDGDRRMVEVGEDEVGVFLHQGAYYAYSNYCLHQGGPACEGLIIAKTQELLNADKTSRGLSFSKEQTNFVCPWHGYEYDITTGECDSDRRLRLRRYEVIEKSNNLYLVA
jgi:nitrite reductase/ring-hydroxylating ferredoxin subunit